MKTTAVRRRVLYFSIGTFAPTSYVLGGNIYGKNLVQRLSADECIELFVLNANHSRYEKETATYFKQAGIPLLFVPVLPVESLWKTWTALERLQYKLRSRLRFPYELEAYGQTQVSVAANLAISRWRIDYIVVDYLLATLFWRELKRIPIQKALVTVNREADLFADILSLGMYAHRGWSTWINHWRLARYERRTHRVFDKVVAIGSPDVPAYLPASKTAVITSYLDERPNPWSYSGNKTVFFVGNVGHYPNRLAINYIVSQIAPRVLARDAAIRFSIIGASPGQVEANYHSNSIDLLGVSTPEEVDRLFRSAALFLCPIQNTFGMKFKVAEAISYGTPFIASEETMLGFPYLRGLPQLRLADPDECATTIVGLLANSDRLKELSAAVLQRHRDFASSQKSIWSRTLFSH